MDKPRICVPRLIKPEQRKKSVQLAINENPLNRVFNANPFRLAVEVRKKWANGRILHVKFLNGDDVQKSKCEREAHKWEEYANIKFVFDDTPDAQVHVSFYDEVKFNDDGSWSYLGTDCLLIPQDEPTTHFGWLDRNTDDAEWERVVVHEFGHVLGCDHEDQQPAQKIQWNKDAVYKYFTGPPNYWSKQDVDDNVLNPSDPNGVDHTEFDPNSIMAYYIPASFTLDGKGVQGGDTLSDLDKQFIGQMYPFDALLPSVINLIPNGPTLYASISTQQPHNLYSFDIISSGKYRIWTSYTKGFVSISPSNDIKKILQTGIQQITVALDAGEYTVSVDPPTAGVQTEYRIHAAKVK